MKNTVLISSFLGRGQRWRLVALVALFFVAGCTVELYPPVQEVINLPDGGKVDVLPDTIPRAFAFGPRMYWSQIVASDSAYSIAVTDANNKGRWLDSLRWVPSGPFVTVNGDTLSTRAYARDNSGVTGDNQILTYNGSGSLTIEDGNTVDMSDLLDNTDAQTIDTLTLQGDTMLQMSLSGDGAPVKELDLSALRSVVDSTRLTQDSILVYYQDGAEVGRDTIAGTGGSETITLSGDVTGSGTTAITTTIATGAVGADELASTAVTPGSYTSADITIDADGRITSAASGGGADNLGDHTMTQNLQTNGNWISGDGGNEGIGVDASGKVGIGTLTPSYILDLNSTDAVRLPLGTTAQNPTGANGLLRYNSDSTAFTGYYNAQWNRLVDHSFLYSSTARSAVNYWKKNGDLLNYGVNNAGRVGIGVNLTSIYKFGVTARSTDGFSHGTYSVFNFTPGSGYAEGTGMQSSVNYTPTASGSSGYAKGGMFSSVHSGSFPGLSLLGGEFAVNSASSSTLNSAIAGRFLTDVNNTSSTTNAIGGFFGLRANGTTSITNYTGLQVGVYAVRQNSTIGTLKGIEVFDHAGTSGTNSIVTQYGLYIHPQISGTTNYAIYSAGGQSYHSGKLGLGVTTPTAQLHLPAGTATANTAPLKFTSGTNLTTPEAGAMEWDGTNLYITQTTGPTRKTIAYVDTDDGSASDTTDGSGDITVSHTLGSASITVTATATGTTFYHVQVHTKTSTTFKIRFFDAAGAAVTATAVTADWIAKLQ